MKRIALIDPSKNATNDFVANNIGDEIIFNAIHSNFLKNIDNTDLNRFTAHRSLKDDELDQVNSCDYAFFGGTNIVSTDVCHNSRWLPKRRKFYYLMPGINDLVFIGVGMNSYSEKQVDFLCRIRTKLFYNNLLSKKYLHSVRDHQTLEALNNIGIKNVLFTACPTLWDIDKNIDFNIHTQTKKCVFSLTDYDQDIERDNIFLLELLDVFETLQYFPQGANDLEYLMSLKNFKNNQNRITVLPRSLSAIEELSKTKDFIYIGTRLHLGIFFLNRQIKSLIIGIDNRALEMKNSVNIPVIKPSEFNLIRRWFNGEKLFGSIKLPVENIQKWKNQFI